MTKNKQYREIEKALEQKYKGVSENEASLNADDFKDGKLTVCGYDRLKNQCDYIPYSEEIIINIPSEFESGFKDSLDFLAANELSRIRKDRREARITSLLLLLSGVLFFALGFIFERFQRELFWNIVIIISWVFIWAAAEKWFFDRKDLREKKSLLQILTAKISPQDTAK